MNVVTFLRVFISKYKLEVLFSNVGFNHQSCLSFSRLPRKLVNCGNCYNVGSTMASNISSIVTQIARSRTVQVQDGLPPYFVKADGTWVCSLLSWQTRCSRWSRQPRKF